MEVFVLFSVINVALEDNTQQALKDIIALLLQLILITYTNPPKAINID